MNQVHVIESFEDLRKAFLGSRAGGDPEPVIEQDVVLEITVDSLFILSTRYMLSEEMRHCGKEFVMWCIEQQVKKADLSRLFPS